MLLCVPAVRLLQQSLGAAVAWHACPPGLREERLLGAHDAPGAVGQVVNGPDHAGAVGAPPTRLVPPPPEAPDAPHPQGWRNVLLDEGPDGFARAVRAHKGTLLTDTTWCAAAAQAPTGRPELCQLCSPRVRSCPPPVSQARRQGAFDALSLHAHRFSAFVGCLALSVPYQAFTWQMRRRRGAVEDIDESPRGPAGGTRTRACWPRACERTTS